MDAVLFGGEPISDKGTMVNRVLEYVQRFYSGEVKEDLLREWAIAAVDHVWGDGPHVTQYVPMLALREVRAQVVESLETSLAAGQSLPPEAMRDIWLLSTQHVHDPQTVQVA